MCYVGSYGSAVHILWVHYNTDTVTLHMPIAVIIDNFAAGNPAAVFTFVLVSRHFVLSLMKSNH